MTLATHYDAALFDLDGVVYLGLEAIPGVPEALRALRDRGRGVGFVTNNAARTPEAVAEHLNALGIEAAATDVVNSTMATIRMLRQELPEQSRLLAVGTDALRQQLVSAGFIVVESRHERPRAVVQGYSPTIEWTRLEEAALAVQDGADWFATNPDLTRPSIAGLVPGLGAQLLVVQACVTVEPKIAGKPYPPLLIETIDRLAAARPVFVGDRLDTDVLGANNVGIDSLFVFTGAHGKRDLLQAVPELRPTFIGFDVGALHRPPRVASWGDEFVVCGAQRARAVDGQGTLDGSPAGVEQELDALWALLQLCWRDGVDITSAAAKLAHIP